MVGQGNSKDWEIYLVGKGYALSMGRRKTRKAAEKLADRIGARAICDPCAHVPFRLESTSGEVLNYAA